MVRCLVLAVLVAIPPGCSGKPAAPLPAIGQELSTVPGVSIKRVDGKDRGALLRSNGKVEAKVASLLRALELACDDNLDADPDALPDGAYDVSFTPGPNDRKPWPSLAQAYEKAFSVRIVLKTREEEIYVLGLPDGAGTRPPKGLKASDPQSRHQSHSTDKGYSFRGRTMEDLTDFLGKNLDGFVLNETGLDGEYDFALETSFLKTDLPRAVEQLGLTLKRAKRPIKAWFVEKTKPGAADE